MPPEVEASTESMRRDGGRSRAVVVLIAVAGSSAAGIVFEVALTRVFAVAQFYHFAFLSVSLALLGFGASGSALAAFPGLGRGGHRRWAAYAVAQSVTTIGAYLVVNALPFDSFAIAWDRRQLVYLAVYYVSLAVPFFFTGLVIAVLLSGDRQHQRPPSHRVYAASLGGSGIGALLALAGLEWVGAEGTIVVASAVAMAAAAGFLGPHQRLRTGSALIVAIGLLVLAAAVPAPLELRLSPYKDLSGALRYPGAVVDGTEWDRGTRIDLVRSDGIRSLPGLSLTYGAAPPVQDGLTFDGDDLSPIPRVDPADAGFAEHMLTSLAFRLRPAASVLILEPRGGLDVVVALAVGAEEVHVVEPHRDVVRLAGRAAATVYDDPRVTVTHTDPRTFVARTDDHFDVVDLALTSPYRPVASGAYSLAETYTLTVEAFERYLHRLAPGGIFTAVRWVQTPPSEEIRLLATAAAAVRNAGGDPAASIVMLRSYSTALLLVQPDGFAQHDLERVVDFAEAERFDLVAAPGLDPALANRFNIVPDERYTALASAVLSDPTPETVYRTHPYAITPPTDDHPFFGHYFTWAQTSTVLDTLGRTWQPFGGAGFFVLIALLAISTLAALLLITAPLLVRRRREASPGPRLRWWTLGYFGLLGVAFLLVEIPLLQQYILLVGHPATAFAVVLFAILAASGVGSALSRRVPWRLGSVVLTAAAAVYPFAVEWCTPLVLPAPLPVRVVVAAAMVAPLGFMMGVMFPRGVTHLEEHAPALVPWAWAINGTMSVIAAAGAAVLALSWGFSVVVRLGALAYAGAALLSLAARSHQPLPRRGLTPRTG